MDELKPCPCGQTPVTLHLHEGYSSKYAFATGDCCDSWEVEFRTNYLALDTTGAMNAAVAAWNANPRPIEDALRAEVAAHGKTIGEWRDFLCRVSDMLWGGELGWTGDKGLIKMGNELKRRLDEVAALKAELEKFTETLTADQASRAFDIFTHSRSEAPLSPAGVDDWQYRDAAIREVRGKA